MQRRPEPELMDDPAQARAYAEADFAEPHNRFVDEFRTRFGADFSGRVLDLGCGPGDICIRFAMAFPAATLVGIDGADAMLRLGREAVAARGLGDRIELRRHRLPDPRMAGERYDAVISNSLLHHLDDPAVLWRSVRRHGVTGGPVCVMDLLRPETEQDAERLVALHAADAPAVLRHDFLHSLLAAYRPDEVRRQLRAAGLDTLAVDRLDEHHLLISGRLD